MGARGVTGAPWNGGEALGVVVRVGREGGEVGRTAGVFLAAAKHASCGPAGPQRPPRVDCLPARRGRRRVLHVFPAAPSADEREDACDGHDHQSAANSAGNRWRTIEFTNSVVAGTVAPVGYAHVALSPLPLISPYKLTSPRGAGGAAIPESAALRLNQQPD